MKAGDLVYREAEDTSLSLGLVLKVYYGCTFTEVKVLWFNVKTFYGKNIIDYCAPRFLKIIS
mgnify:CR=1 FL=1